MADVVREMLLLLVVVVLSVSLPPTVAESQNTFFRRQNNFARRQQEIVFPSGSDGQFSRFDFRQPSRSRPISTTTTTTTTTTTPQSSGGQLLEPPVIAQCVQRPKQWFYNGHWYFLASDVAEYRAFDPEAGKVVGKKYNWLEARNLCRRHCMDSVSLETEDEWLMIKNNISQNDLPYIWSSGRLCDFKGCDERTDLKPINVNGWFWSGSNARMAATDKTPPGWRQQPWSYTGHKKQSQPDNAEFDINRTSESCLGLLNNIYDDGLQWHDIACYHRKTVICEDSDRLLEYAQSVLNQQQPNRAVRL